MSDEQFAWRGGPRHPNLALTQEQLIAARAELERAAAAQQALDSAMRVARDALDSQRQGSLVGMGNSLKDEESYLRKVSEEVGSGRTSVEEAIESRAHDLNRYTLTFPVESYVDGVSDAIAQLQQQGFTLSRGTDMWEESTYKGINTTWHHEATERRVEVQFHTPESFQAKQDTHPTFEVQRAQQFADGRIVTREHWYAAQEMQAERYRESGREVTVPAGHEMIEPERIARPPPRAVPAPVDVQTQERARAEVAAEAELVRQEHANRARLDEPGSGLRAEGAGLRAPQRGGRRGCRSGSAGWCPTGNLVVVTGIGTGGLRSRSGGEVG